MAYDRETFKNKIEEHLRGALGEFYKAQLAEKNGYVQWVVHWRTEVTRLLEYGLFSALRHTLKSSIRPSGRRKAFLEVQANVQADDAAYRRWATNVVLRDFRAKTLTAFLDDADTARFWQQVKQVSDEALQP